MIQELYEINNGFLIRCLGALNFQSRKVKRKLCDLWKQHWYSQYSGSFRRCILPFIAGVLYTNDVDYRLARLLADQVITEKPFMEISGETFRKLLKAMESCDRVICTSVPVGSCNKRLGELIEAAKKSRKGSLY